MSHAADILALLDKHTPANLWHRVKVDLCPKAKADPLEIRRAAVRAAIHRPGKNTRTPDYVLRTMHEEYHRQPSLASTARVFGCCTSHVFYLLKKNGLKLRSKVLQPRIVHNGVPYAWDGRGYYRQTARGKQGILLHKVTWEERHGPVPDGHRLIFLSADRRDFSDTNLCCVTMPEYWAHIGRFRRGKRHTK